jgi:hypothetical protein
MSLRTYIMNLSNTGYGFEQDVYNMGGEYKSALKINQLVREGREISTVYHLGSYIEKDQFCLFNNTPMLTDHFELRGWDIFVHLKEWWDKEPELAVKVSEIKNLDLYVTLFQEFLQEDQQYKFHDMDTMEKIVDGYCLTLRFGSHTLEVSVCSPKGVMLVDVLNMEDVMNKFHQEGCFDFKEITDKMMKKEQE